MHKGFTLIELLVVVLIIGILAAVAVPQYTKAVEKSRLAAIRPMIKSIKDAQTTYYMANGEYGPFSSLDISFPNCQECGGRTDYLCCPDSFFQMAEIEGKMWVLGYTTPRGSPLRTALTVDIEFSQWGCGYVVNAPGDIPKSVCKSLQMDGKSLWDAHVGKDIMYFRAGNE